MRNYKRSRETCHEKAQRALSAVMHGRAAAANGHIVGTLTASSATPAWVIASRSSTVKTII